MDLANGRRQSTYPAISRQTRFCIRSARLQLSGFVLAAGVRRNPCYCNIRSAASTSNASFLPKSAGTFVLILFFVCILFRLISRRWIAEIDLATRRLKISRLSFGRWRETIVDCPFDECSKLGKIEYNTDGHVSYGVHVELRRGTRHAIPLRSSKFNEATRLHRN